MRRCLLTLLLSGIWTAFLAPGATATQSIEALFNVSIPGIPLGFINASGINTTLLKLRLEELAASTNPEFAGAVLGEITEILMGAGVSVAECPIGSYTNSQGLLCISCPPGTYSTQALASSNSTCQLCPKGTFSNASAASSLATCLACPANSFGAIAGATSAAQCQGCPLHASAPTGAQSVDACVCNPGYYAHIGPYSTACFPCETGQYCTGGVSNQCPSHPASRSLALAASPADCFCTAGYFGVASDAWGCMQCNPGSYCPGGPDGLALACPAASTSEPGSTSLTDCACASGYKQQNYETAVRSLAVTATPCACSTTYPCPSLDADPAKTCTACAQGSGCVAGTTLTCRQGNIELPLVSGTYPKVTGTIEWVIAPEGGARGITLTFSTFCTASQNDKLIVYQCKALPCNATNSEPVGTLLSQNGVGGPSCTTPLKITLTRSSGLNYAALRLVWTAAAGNGIGWKASYATALTCSMDLTTQVQSINYASTGIVDLAPPQPNITSPIVVWVGDTVVLSSAAGSTVDITEATGAAALTSERFALYGQWWPMYRGHFYIVDFGYPTRFREIVVLPIAATHWDIYVDVVSSGSAFSLSGDVEGINSPTIYATLGDTVVLSRVTSLDPPPTNLDPYKLLIATSALTEIPESTLGILGQRSLHITWDTAESDVPAGVYYYVSAANPLVNGKIVLTGRPTGLTCSSCQPDEYCASGKVINCPANSHSPSFSTSVDACLCDAGLYTATTDVAGYNNGQSIDTGGRHTCVVTDTHQLACWGANEQGQLGLGKLSATEPPTLVPGLANVQTVQLGDDYTCVTYNPASAPTYTKVKCVGGNLYGQLGQDIQAVNTGTTPFASLPDTNLGDSYTAFHLSCAAFSCCAVVQSGVAMQRSLRCFGKNSYGQLGWHDSAKGMGTGYTSPTGGSYPSKTLMGENMPITTTGIEVATMTSVGGDHTCALVGEGNVWCHGLNKDGAVGIGQTLQQLAIAPPTPVNLDGKLAKTINCYLFVCCVIFQTTYEVSCFGQGANGRLGVGFYNIGETASSMGANLPIVPIGAGAYAMDIAVGAVQTCVLLGNNHARCFGIVAGKTIGTNPAIQMDEFLPDIALQSGRVALQIAGKGKTMVAILSNYKVVAWGDNSYLQLGTTTPGLAARRLLAATLLANVTNMTVVPLPTGVEAVHSSGVPNTLICSVCTDNYYCSGSGAPMAQCQAHASSPPQSVASSSCRCNLGYTANNSQCSLCSGINYCSLGAMGTCPQFATTAQSGAFDILNCSCVPGYTGANGGACTPCSIGSFKNSTGPDNCTICPPGYASSVLALNSSLGCIQCAAGTFAVAGSQQCTTCQAGTASIAGSSACGTCAAGSYAVEGAGVCISCGVGTYDSDPNGGGPNSCTKCVIGTHSNQTGANASSVCVRCLAGFISLEGAAVCSSCPANTYSYSGTGECLSCPTNSSSLPGSPYANCTCAAGFYRNYYPDLTTFTCAACPAGTYSQLGALECTPCAAGSASPNLTATSAATCVACRAGFFAPSQSSSCAACPIWSYALASSGQCTNCSIGYYAPAQASICSACAPGKYSTTPGIGSIIGCLSCLPGFYCPGVLTSPNNQLIQCPIGTYSISTSAKTASQCLPCAAGYYCPIPSQQLQCPQGTTSNVSSTSQLSCVCQKGYQCVYQKVVQAMVSLLMSPSDFDDPAVRAAFINAVASSAKVSPSNVQVISVHDTITGETRSGRRLLQAQKRMERAAAGENATVEEDDSKIHVILQVDHATELRDLDLHLFTEGLEPSYDHVFYAPHQVVVTAQ